MNSEAETAAPKKRPPISLPFIVVVGILGVGAYFAGRPVMEWVMLQQEKAKVAKGAVAFDLPDERPNLPSAGGGDGGGDRDPAALFASRDEDGNGKLEGDEINERMQARLSQIDTDGDGAISEDEFVSAVEEMRSRRGGDRAARPASDDGNDGESGDSADNAADDPTDDEA